MSKSVFNFHSEVLGFHTTVCVAFPEPQVFDSMSGPKQEERKVLYLLHGMHGGAHSWISNSNVERYLAESKQNMVIVMPEIGNDFYMDQTIGWKYFTYVAEELPRIIQTFLRISPKRENTYVAGLSMGGYGAMKMALTYPEKFSFAASFSGALDVFEAMKNHDPHFAEFLFGSADMIPGSVNDLFYLLKKVDEEKKQKPELYVSCGSADRLFESNVRFTQKARELEYGVTFHEEVSEGHSWRFWDREVEKLLRVLI